MGITDDYRISASFVTMEHRLAVVGITPEWGVKINGSLCSEYSAEQGVCFAGLIRAIDSPLITPWLRNELRELDRETGGSVSKVINPESPEIDALLDIIGTIDSPIANNYFRIGKLPTKIVALMGNAADYDSADERLARYFLQYPERADEEFIVRGIFRTYFFDRENALRLRKQTSNPAPSSTLAAPTKPKTPQSKTNPELSTDRAAIPVNTEREPMQRRVNQNVGLDRNELFAAVRILLEGLEPGSEILKSSLPKAKRREDYYLVLNTLVKGGYKITV